MKLKAILFYILISISYQSFSQELVAMFKDKGKWGFIDEQENILVKPIFSFCRPMTNGMAKIDKTKFVNIKGEKIAAKHILKEARGFSDGLSAISSGKWGYMNTNGETIIPEKFDFATDFNNGYALVTDKNGSFVIDKKGNLKEIKINSGKITHLKPFTENKAPIEINGKWGFVDTNGVIIIEPKFVNVGYFGHNLAWVRVEGNSIGYINTLGNWVIEPKLIGGGIFDESSGVARIKNKNGWGYMNIKGELLPIKNIEVYNHFEDGVCLVRSKGKWGYLNPDGSWLIVPTYSSALSFKNDFAPVQIKGKWGVINKKGELIIQPKYEYIKNFNKAN